jgi:hypothetical protein
MGYGQLDDCQLNFLTMVRLPEAFCQSAGKRGSDSLLMQFGGCLAL